MFTSSKIPEGYAAHFLGLDENMKLGLEKFSYLSGEARLNSKPLIMEDIEAVLLRPRIDIAMLLRDQFMELSRADFLARGWDAPPPIRRGGATSLMDLIKGRIGLQLGFQSLAILTDVLKFQAAYDSAAAKIDVGVYVVGTVAFQNQMRKETGKSWSGLNFTEVARKLPTFGRVLKVPICLVGLDVVEAKEPSSAINIKLMSPTQVKEVVFAFLEKKYGRSIDQNVCLMGMSSETDMEFDGIMRFADMDLIIEIEASTVEGLHSRVFADTTRSISQTLQAYQRLTGRQAALRFILLGGFHSAYIRNIVEHRCNVYGASGEKIAGYEIYPLEELGLSDKF